MADTKNTPTHKVYWIRDRGEAYKPAWMEIGVGFTNRDGSVNLMLNVVPLDGRIQLRVNEPKQNGGRA